MIEQKPGHLTGAEIAVIGMAGRFPGADKIDQFWENLKNGVESLTFLSDRELEEAGVSAELMKNPGYVKTGGGMLENKEYFDASFFGYTPLEAQLLNPQIRVFYECAWEALESAAYNPFSGSQLIGIFAGASSSFHWEALAMLSGDVGTVGGFTLPLLTEENNLSTRLAYHLNLKGPAVAVQTACSTSLVAIHMACQALLNGECDMALAGGVSINSQQMNGYLYQAGMVNSPDGHCRAFDARAKGMIIGEGCGVVVLKRLEHAAAGGDYIHAVIKGTAINNDGIRKVGYTAPSVTGQAEVIQVTHQVAEVEPESITYLETHGTGTILGDPIEIRALTRAFKTDKKGYCAVGSVKTNIGHLASAAGVASFIKTVLALKYRSIPPSLHVETPNPEIDFENSPFFVNNRLREWKTNGYPLRAGISSFGIGGTNAHIILEEWSPQPSPGASNRDFQLVLISAKTPTALERMTENLVDYLKENPGVNLADVAYTLQVGRRAFPCKKMTVCPNANVEEVIAELSSTDSRKVHTFSSEEGEKQVVFMFCGQGAHYIDMGLELYQKEPLFRRQMDRCFDILRPLMDYDLREVFLPGLHSTSSYSSPGGKDELIHRQDLSQPMFFVFEFALAQLLMKWGIKPDAMIGYSIGEYAAAHLAGVFSLEDALTLVALRGKLMQQLPPGVMLSVPVPEEELRPLLNKELSLAAVNEPTCIVAGSNGAIGAFERTLREKKYMCRRLSISHAGHSVMLDSMLEEFKGEFGPVHLAAPEIPYISSLTGRWITDEEATSPGYWARHLRETVRFSDGIKELMRKAGSVFIEIGPGHDLSALIKRYIDSDNNHGHRHQAVNMIRHRQKEVSDMYYLMSRIGHLWLYGVGLDWNKLYAKKARRRLPLPTYPFESQQYWLEGNLFDIYAKKSSSPSVREALLRKKPDMADWFYVPSWRRSLLPEPGHDKDEDRPGQNKTGWLVFLDDNGGSGCSFGSLCVDRLRQDGHEVRTVELGREFKKFRQDAYTIDPGEYHDYCRLFDDLYNLEEEKRPKRIVHFGSLSRNCPDRLSPEAAKRAQELGFYSILNIGRAIGRQRSKSGYRIDVVTNNIQEVTGDEVLAPHKATILGPLKVIPQEYPNIRCRCIDVVLPPPGSSQEEIIVEQVAEELKAHSADPVIAYRSNFRWLQTFEPVRLEKSPPAKMLREGGVYLITGGLGRIGLILAEYLARTVKARLILTGRSAVPPGDEKKIRKIQQLEELGAEVLVMSADAADSRQMRAVIDRAEKRFGPINGVIHSSVVPQDQAFNLVEHISKDKCELQFQAKIYGVLVLEELLRDKEFDFCLLMSSIASVLGGLGFAAYAAANLFMDLFVRWCGRTDRGRWLSVNWDGWQVEDADSGNGDPAGVGATLTRLRMTPEEGQEAFQRILSSTRANHFIQTPGDLHTRIDQWIKLESIKAEGESAAKPSTPLLTRPNLLSTYKAPRSPIEETMVEIFQSMFGVEPIGIQDDFFELGGDSLKAITVIAVIHRRLNIEIPLSLFFAGPTIEKLAGYVEDTEGGSYTSIPAVEKKEYYPLSSPQKRLYILQAMNERNIGYNEMKMVLLEGSLEREKFETAFHRLIERHEVFRTSIRMVDREPMQTINDEVEFEIEYYESGPSIENILKNFVRPFDLSRAPFFRVGLIKIGERQHLLMIDMHHIVTDGVSHEIFVGDILAFYAGRELPPLRIQYKDYAEWLNSPRQQAALERWEAYWLHQFQDNIPVLNLPTDYVRPEIQSFEGHAAAFWLDREETRQLKELAAAHDVTLYMVLLAIFDVFLAKVSGQEDVVVGTGVAGRRHSDLLNIIGIFVNTLAVRNYPNLRKTFRQLLKEVKETTLGAFENQEYPFEMLVEKVDIVRDTGRNPLFDVMLVLQNVDVQVDGKPGTAALSFPPTPAANLEVKPYGYHKRISKFDLTLFVEEINGRLFCYFEYATRLFKSTTIDWFIIFFKEIAALAVSNPDQRLREIQEISRERREEIIFQLNKQLREETGALTGINDTLQQRLNRSFKKHRYSTVVECGGRVLTYGELDRRSNCIAGWLIDRGVSPETLIGISIEDRLAFIPVMIGILKARCVFVPWDAGYPRRRLEVMTGASGVQLIFTDDRACFDQRFAQEVEFILTDADQLLWSGHVEAGREVGLSYSPEDSVYIYFTSGTTGTPRAMRGKNRSLLHFIDWEVHTFGIDESFRFSQLTTPLFDAFLRDIFVPLCTGGAICVPGSKEVMLQSGQLIRWLEQSRIHLMHCVPALFRLLKSREHLFDSSLQELKYILLSGERLNPTDLVGWYDTVGERIRLVNLWGTSETTLAKTYYFVQPSDVHRERIPVGKPLPGARVVVLDDEMEICDPLVGGQLYIKTPFRTVGYHNEPELNAQRFIPDPFSGETEILLHKTGDLGRILPDGNIDVIGRDDRQVKIRGIRVELEEIESVCMKHPLVSEVVVVKREISIDNDLLCAYLTSDPGTEGEEELLSRVEEYVSGQLPGYMVPAKFLWMEKIPRKPSGKVDYDALPDPLAVKEPDLLLPRDRVEERLLDLWADILGIEKENIGINQSFFELGGNSLNIMALTSRIHREFDIQVSLPEIFNNITIRHQAVIIRTFAVDKYASIKAVEKRDYYPQSSAQKRLFFLDQLDEIGTSYNISGVLGVKGGMDKARYEKSFRALIARHESLRTSFGVNGDEPIQRIHKVEELEFAIEYYAARSGEEVDHIIDNFIRPFDLSKAPLLRIGLVGISTEEHFLMYDMHHIISDGTSMKILPDDFLKLFGGENLPSLRVQYKGFSIWQKHLFETGQINKQEEYWLNLYSGEIPRLNLPTDYVRPAIQSFEGRNAAFWLDREETRQLKELAAAHDVTLYMVLLAIFDVFLAKVSGQEDVVVGTGVAGRRHSDLLNIMGIFVNTLAVRNYPNLWKTFRQLLKEVKEATLGAFENQEYPFEMLVEKVDIVRDTGRNPLFDVMLMLQNIDVQVDGKPGTAALSFAPTPAANLEVKPYGYHKRISKFDLTLFVEEINGQLLCYFEYATRLFKSTTIDWFIIFFKEIAALAVSNPDQRLREIQEISRERREEIIFQLNKQLREETGALTGINDTLQQRLNRSFKKHRYSTVVECGGRVLTYGELDRRSNCVAGWLIDRGVSPETLIGISIEDRLAFISIMIGILKARCVFVPWDAGYPRRRLEVMTGASGVQLIFTDDRACFDQRFAQEVEFILTDADQLLWSGHVEAGREVGLSYSPEDSVYIYFTSGTTGTPRAMRGKNRSLLHFIDWEVHTFGIDESFRFSQLTTPLFDAFLRDIFVPLCTGGAICVPGSKEVMLQSGQLIRWLEQSRIHLMHCVPALFRLLKSREHLFDSSLQELKYILLSGERLNPTDLVGWYDTVGERIRLVNLWGTSETTLAKTYYFVQPSDVHRERIPVGKPLPGARVVVLDDEMEICDPLVGGQLYIKTPFRTVGYHNEPELNAQRFIPDPFSGETGILLHKTGDLGRILPDGNIDVIGRDDRQVKIRGIRVELEEIESVCMKHPLVSEVVVVKREISIDNELLCAYLTLDSTTGEESLSRVEEYVSGQLPGYMVPAKFLWVEKIPRKPSGKVDYDALPDPLAVKEPDFQLPRDRVEERLLELWADILGIEKESIGISQSFFELGGNSLNIMTLISRIHREFDIRISLKEIFNNITIRHQAVIIRTFAVDKYASIKAVEKRDYYPQSSAQKRLFFLDQFDEIGTSYNISGVLGARGGMDKTRYEDSFRALIARHESLRTSFEVIGDEPIQRVHKVEKLEFAVEYYAAKSGEAMDSVINNFIRPFDLSKAPLLRIGLVGISTEAHFLMYDMHHIVSDGTSGRILRDEFIRLYNDEVLPGLRVQYKDFSMWQNNLLETGRIREQETYWLEMYPGGEIPRLNLPTDYPRPKIMNFIGENYSFGLEAGIASELKNLCTRSGVTLYISLLTVFNILLWRYTGQQDIIVGSAIAGRPHADLQNIIGMFVNMLAMRNQLEEEESFLEFLRKVKENSLKAFENQDVQFEDLVDKLDLERDTSRNPLFSISFVVQNMESPPSKSYARAASFSPYHFEKGTSIFDMSLHAFEVGDEIGFRLTYYSQLFRRSTIERFSSHFLTLTNRVVSTPDIQISEIDILSEDERKKLVEDFNRFDEPHDVPSGIHFSLPDSGLIHELFSRQVEVGADHIAMVLMDQFMSYGELDVRSNQLAGFLYNERQVKRDDRVGILMDRSVYMIEAIFGILKSGGAYVPLDSSWPEERLRRVIDDAGIGVVISQKRYLKVLNRLQWECGCLHTIWCLDSDNIYLEEEVEKNELMDRELWEYVGEEAVDEIGGGGWKSSYTGELFSQEEMAEYGDNALEKIRPLLSKESRVLEIGCASGITMYRIAPEVDFYYGTDLSRVIIEKNRQRIRAEGFKNISLAALAAHEIDQLEGEAGGFDVVILNSVIQNFHGHNYLRGVIGKCIGLMAEEAYIFIGDVMDQELKGALIEELVNFKRANADKDYRTTTDFSSALFVSRGFFEDLRVEFPGIEEVYFSGKIHSIENELTKFRYDVVIKIDKRLRGFDRKNVGQKHKYQYDGRVLARYGGERVRAAVDSGDLAYVIFTSGSTGRPKGVMIEHRNVVKLVLGLQELVYRKYRWSGGLRVALLAPLVFDASVKQIFAALLLGHQLHLVDEEIRIDGEALLEFYSRSQIDISDGTPSHLHLFLESMDLKWGGWSGFEIGVQNFLVGGEVLSKEVAESFLDKRFPLITNVYGPTECCVDTTLFEVSLENIGELSRIPIGSPLPHVRVYILDGAGRVQPLGVVGELCIGGGGVGRGYLNNSSLTAERFVESRFSSPGGGRLYRSGDLARWLCDGRVEFLGRVDEQVKVRGYRIELGEIEKVLLGHEDIREAVVLVLGSESVSGGDRDYIKAGEEAYGHDIYAYIVAAGEMEVSELREYLSVELPGYMIPSYFVQVDEILLTASGKVDRRGLVRRSVEIGEGYVAPRNEVESKLVEIWSDIVHIESGIIGIEDDFFELGGHSLRATILVSKIHRELQVKVPIAEIFKSPTIAELSRFIVNRKRSIYEEIRPVEKREYYPQSSAQKRLFFLDQFEDIGTSYNMPYILKIRGEMVPERYEKTFKALIARHEALRTLFGLIGNDPVQILRGQVDFEIEMILNHDKDEIITKEYISKVIDGFICPFDLSKAPLVRAGLMKISEEEYLLLFDMHHIVGDGTSITILIGDFIQLYVGEELPLLKVQYKDFSMWQNNLTQTGTIREQEEYWLNLYSDTGQIPALNLPTDYPRKSVFDFEGAIYHFRLNAEDTAAFKELARESGATLYMNLLAAFNVLLHKYSGQDDIIVGTGIAGRPHADLQNIIGMFVNTLAIRNYPQAEQTYLEFLNQVKNNCVKAFGNQDVQFEELVERISPERTPARNPIFSVELNVQNFDRPAPPDQKVKEAADGSIVPYGYERTTSKFDMILYATEAGDEIDFMFEYSTALFKSMTIEKMAQRYVQILKQVVEKQAIKIREIKISHDLTEARPAEIYSEFQL
jgi:amino acid adenylation domain-containing protein